MDSTLVQQQDSLRPWRMFVGGLAGALAGAEQSLAGQDGYSYSLPYQYQVVSPGYGYGIEGAPISATRSGGLVISPMLVLIGIGAAAVLMWKR